MLQFRYRSVAALAVTVLCFANFSLTAGTYTWNSTSSDWTVASSWKGNNLPSGSDSALFNLTGNQPGTTVISPIFSGSQSITNLTIAPNQNLGGWSFTPQDSNASLSISGAISTLGPATTKFDNLSFGSSTPSVNVGTSSTLIATGKSADGIAPSAITISGGTLRFDYSTFAAGSTSGSNFLVSISGGGTLQLYGNSNGTTLNVGKFQVGSSTIGGVNTIQVTPNGALTVLNFVTSSSFSARQSAAAVTVYEATSGNLGDANGARITFSGNPNLGSNGLFSSGSGVGFAIAKDAGGIDFATYSASAGVVRATPTQSTSTATDLQTYTNSDRVQFNPSTSQSATGSIANGSLRITPQASGLSLTLDGNLLKTNALMLDGANSFKILNGSSVSTLGNGNGSRYIYVNNASNTLTTDIVVATGSNNTVFAGPGFVELSGTSSQNSLSSSGHFVIAGGVVRANATQIGFDSNGAGVISLTGGILEIKNGSNGTGAIADFTRPLGHGQGGVTWGGGTTTVEQAGGGFSAYGSAASVSIGGASPTTLIWNSTDFIADGYALKFGSTQSNNVLNFLNNIQLTNGNSVYQMREINVVGGTGGDRTVLQGVISGDANTDLVKTGNGRLQLTAANTYSGNTIVQGGSLFVDGVHSGTGRFQIGDKATLGGIGTIPGTIYVNGGGTLAPGGISNVGLLTVSNNVSFAGNTSTFRIRANGSAVGDGTSTTGYDRLYLTSGTIDLNNAILSVSTGYTPSAADHLTIISGDYSSGARLINTFKDLSSNGSTFVSSGVTWAVYYNVNPVTLASGNFANVVLVPVPEPGHILLLCFAAVGAGCWIYKKWRGKPAPVST